MENKVFFREAKLIPFLHIWTAMAGCFTLLTARAYFTTALYQIYNKLDADFYLCFVPLICFVVGIVVPFAMHYYDKIIITNEGITEVKFGFTGKTTVTRWEEVYEIIYHEADRNRGHFRIYCNNDRIISFYFSNEIKMYLRSLYSGKIVRRRWW